MWRCGFGADLPCKPHLLINNHQTFLVEQRKLACLREPEPWKLVGISNAHTVSFAVLAASRLLHPSHLMTSVCTLHTARHDNDVDGVADANSLDSQAAPLCYGHVHPDRATVRTAVICKKAAVITVQSARTGILILIRSHSFQLNDFLEFIT